MTRQIGLYAACFFALLALPSAAAPRASQPPAVTYDADGFTIHGRRQILLIGTVAYFRLDPSDWDRRLAAFAASGFNTVDCLVPWNYHEPVEGRFDFQSPTHDLPRFLRLCQKHGLNVFLRSGPYICDEWDGGGFPAWLIPKPGIAYRQNNPTSLSLVRRWTRALDRTIAPYQATRGGPIILDQIENELDFYDCRDPRGYITHLRDAALADGITVPLTVCIGSPNHRGDDRIERASGHVNGVLPTANLYVRGNVEAQGRQWADTLRGARFAGGASLSSVPPINSETGRDENTLRRLLASGLKGLAPFDFAGGSNFLYGSGDNRWEKPIGYIVTSLDFGSMIGFDGARTSHWYEARRLAGFVNTFVDPLCRAQSDTNWEGGFSASNAALGAKEDPARPGRLYRLAAPNGPQFLFLWNGDTAPQQTTVTLGGLSFPRHSTLTVPPSYDLIVPAQVSLDAWGLPGVTLRYATSEVYKIARSARGTQITLVGDEGGQGELCLQSAAPPRLLRADGAAPQTFPDAQGWTAAYHIDATRGMTLQIGGRQLEVHILSRQGMDAPAALVAPATDLLAGAVWQTSSTAETGVPPVPNAGADPPPMEAAGLLHGAAWYRAEFDAPPGASAEPLTFSHAGDLVSAYLNGRYLGTRNGLGNDTRFDTGTMLHSGRNRLAVRVEIWGHSNFQQNDPPALHLGAPRGIWGPVRLGAAPLAPASPWRLTTDSDTPPPVPPTSPKQPLAFGAAGEEHWISRAFSPTPAQASRGMVLELAGADLLASLYVNGHGAGRCLYGPAVKAPLHGGPSNKFYVPAAWLRPGPNRLTLRALALSDSAALTRLDAQPAPR